MKKFTKIATSIVAGCALLGITTGGAILLNEDDRDIIVNVETTPQEPEIPEETPVEDEIPEETPTEDETPTEETPSEEEPKEETSSEDIPPEEETTEETTDEAQTPQENPTEETPIEEETEEETSSEDSIHGYITVEVKLYNRHSDVYTKSDILNFEGEGSISVYNLYEKIKVEYSTRKEFSSPSKSLNSYLDYSNDNTIDLIVYFK